MSDAADAANALAKRFTAEIVGPSNSYNGGRLSGDQANGLAHLAIGTLESQGFAVVKLPKPSPDGNYWYLNEGYFWVDDLDYEYLVTTKHGSTWGGPDEARETALAMLAAATEAAQARASELT